METKEYRICNRCVMDTSDPDIKFDKNGYCSHCRSALEKLDKYWFPTEEGSRKLDNLINNIMQEGKGKDYDCIIGLSGGVDSSYLAYFLRTEYPQLRILAVHVDAGWNSELAVYNIEQIVKTLEIDLYTRVMNWEDMKDLQFAYLKSQLANQDIPQDHAFNAILYHTSAQYGIRYFLSGSNLTSESILPSAWGYDAMDGKQLLAIHKRFGTAKLRDFEVVSFFKRRIYYPYLKKFRNVKPLNYIPYDKEKSKEILMEKIGWRDYGGKHHESRFTKFFQSYWLPKKFGYDKRRAHLSSLIAAEQISRYAAIEELKKPLYDPMELREDKEFLAKKLGLSIDQFDEIMAQPNKTFRDYPSNYEFEIFLRKIISIIKKDG